MCVVIPYRLYAAWSQSILLLQTNTPAVLQPHWKMQHAKRANYADGTFRAAAEVQEKKVCHEGMWYVVW